jgi:hypothetical protein
MHRQILNFPKNKKTKITYKNLTGRYWYQLDEAPKDIDYITERKAPLPPSQSLR